MTPQAEEVAWAAGFLDGEGCIYIGTVKTCFALRVQATQKDRRPLDELQRLFGGSINAVRHNQRNRSYWHWNIGSRQAGIALELLIPHLRLKRDQAEVALAFQRRRINGGTGAGRDPKADEAARDELRALKRKAA